MKSQIGLTAGRIWRTLKAKGSVPVNDLPRELDEKVPIVFQALGWLAREDKVRFEMERNRTMVMLDEA